LVTYRVMGGLVPQARGCVLDTSVLPPDEGVELARLVADSAVLEPRILPHIRTADGLTRSIKVDDHATVVLDQLQVWPELRPLIVFLDAHSADRLGED